MNRIRDFAVKKMYGVEVPTMKTSFGALIDRDMDGKEIDMSAYLGSVLCVVNVACKWGLTKQNYTELAQLVDEYGARGFKVLAFPCNREYRPADLVKILKLIVVSCALEEFGGQEPGSHEEILKFSDKFNARDKFDFFEKGPVNGEGAREVFSFLKRQLPWDDGTFDVNWNFGKFLIDHTGTPSKRFGSKTAPFEMKDDIEALLKEKEKSSS